MSIDLLRKSKFSTVNEKTYNDSSKRDVALKRGVHYMFFSFTVYISNNKTATDHMKVPLRTRSRSKILRCVTKLEKTSLSNDAKLRSGVETIICSVAFSSIRSVNKKQQRTLSFSERHLMNPSPNR